MLTKDDVLHQIKEAGAGEGRLDYQRLTRYYDTEDWAALGMMITEQHSGTEGLVITDLGVGPVEWTEAEFLREIASDARRLTRAHARQRRGEVSVLMRTLPLWLWILEDTAGLELSGDTQALLDHVSAHYPQEQE